MTTDEIIAARSATVLGSVSMRDRLEALDGFLKRLYAMKGYTVADNIQDEVDRAAKELEDRLAHRWAWLTLAEVWLALEAGLLGDYGKDTRLTVQNYLVWVNAYTKSAERREALEEWERGRQQSSVKIEAPRKTPEEQQRSNDEACRSQLLYEWADFKKNGYLDMVTNGCAACLCDYLVRLGKLKARPDTQAEARRRGEQRLRRKRDGLFRNLQILGEDAINLENATKHELLAMYFENLQRRGAELTL